MATQMSERCSKVEIDARKLWVDIDTWKISEAEASARWHEIETKLDAATALETHLGTYKRINRRAEADAAKLVKEEYA